MQEVFISMDDSGVLCKHDTCTVFGGIVFLNRAEKVKFSSRYQNIIDKIQCKYCDHSSLCNHRCPEVKSSHIKPKDRLRLLQLCTNYFCYAVKIDNQRVYPSILEQPKAKGRFLDYVQKMTMKHLLMKLIENQIIDPDQPLTMQLKIDENSIKSDGYYDLKGSIYEELIHSIPDFRYGSKRDAILHNELQLHVDYLDSKTCIPIQGADIIAGSMRRELQKNPSAERLSCIQSSGLWHFEVFP